MRQISPSFLSALLLLNLLGCSKSKVRASAPPPPPVVEVTPVIERNVPVQGEWVGSLQGYVNAQIQPQVSGYLIRQDYHEGAFVKKGQLLFEIDPRPFQAVLDQAKGQLAQAEAQMANADLNVKRDIPEAEAHADEFFAFLPKSLSILRIECIRTYSYVGDGHVMRHDLADVAVLAVFPADLIGGSDHTGPHRCYSALWNCSPFVPHDSEGS